MASVNVNTDCLPVQKSELIMSIPRKVMMTSSTARTSVLGKADDVCKMYTISIIFLYFTEILLKFFHHTEELIIIHTC